MKSIQSHAPLLLAIWICGGPAVDAGMLQEKQTKKSTTKSTRRVVVQSNEKKDGKPISVNIEKVITQDGDEAPQVSGHITVIGADGKKKLT